MEKLTDRELNEMLEAEGLAMPLLERSSKKLKPLVSSSIYNGTGIQKGSTYKGSPYLKVQENLKALSKDFLSEPILELKEGLLEEAIALIQLMKEEGLVVNVPSFVDARKALKAGKAPSNPVEMLLQYRVDLFNASRPINDLREYLVAQIEEDRGMKFLDTSRLSLEWCMAKADLTLEERNYGSRLLATKDVLIAKYEAEAERYLNDSHPLANALLYATLYVDSIKDAQNRKEAKERQRWEDVRTQFVTEYNRYPNANEEAQLRTIIKEKIQNETESGYASLQSLFSLGALQFIQWADKGEVVTRSKTLRSVTGYFGGDHLLTDEERKSWNNLVGQVVEIKDGQLNNLTLDAEDRLRMDEKFVSPKMEELYYYEDEALKRKIHETKYLKGAKAWVGGSQQAVVVHVATFKKGVRVFLMGVKNI